MKNKAWKKTALAMAVSTDISWRAIARELGVPKSSCSDYLRKELSEEVAKFDIRSDVYPIVTTRDIKPNVTHLMIPDTQCKPGISMDYLKWLGMYIVDKKPEVIVHIGDHADMPSLSSYDRGKRTAEGNRVQSDIEASIEGMNTLLEPLWKLQQKELAIHGKVLYTPKMVITLGNHEERIMRHVNSNPELHGFLSYDSLKYKEMGWEVYDYLEPVILNGVTYCHFMANPMTGKPYGGQAMNVLKNVGESFCMGHKQVLDIATRFLPASGKQQWGVIAGACLQQDHKVLTSDLRYIPLKELKVGDRLVSFEEGVSDKRSRRYKEGEVLKLKPKNMPILKVTLESGKEFKVTEDHLWFVKTGSKYHWVETNSLRKGTCIPKLLPEFEKDCSYDSGWLAGIYDGEGSLCKRNTTGGSCFQMAVSQAQGVVLDKMKKVLKDTCEVEVTTSLGANVNKQVENLRVKGGVRNILKVLGKLRPQRLLNKFNPEDMGRINCPNALNDKVVKVEPFGDDTIIQIEVNEGTMIVEGYGHHNCYEHDEGYKGYQGNHHWRGIVVKHNVKSGSFNPMFVDLEYLKSRYGR